jgi:hypothetical protein
MEWNRQRPERPALQRNEEEIEHWERQPWPYLKNRKDLGPI